MADKEVIKQALEDAYLAGFNASCEGYNGEYPFSDHGAHPEQDSGWLVDRFEKLQSIQACRAALAEQDSEPVAWMWVIDGKPKTVSFGGANSNTPKEWTVLPLYTTPQPAPVVQPQYLLSESQVLFEAEAFGLDASKGDVYGFYLDCMSTQPVVKQLTDEQIDRITIEQWGDEGVIFQAHRAYARAIEAAHGIGAPKE